MKITIQNYAITKLEQKNLILLNLVLSPVGNDNSLVIHSTPQKDTDDFSREVIFEIFYSPLLQKESTLEFINHFFEYFYPAAQNLKNFDRMSILQKI